MKTKKVDRKHQRIDSLHLLNYVCTEAATGQEKSGMGRTLNVSQGGILLETHITMTVGDPISLTIGIEDETVDISGKVIHCRNAEEKGRFESGIEFLEIDAAALKVLDKYIIAFRQSLEKS